MADSCPACQCTQGKRFFELTAMPVSIGVQWPSAEEARASNEGDLHLAFCPRCGLIWNRAFDVSRLEYSQQYDNSLDFSPMFQDYARCLAQQLIETYDIRGKEVVEIGCGKGHFLTLLCEQGGNRGIGFDPSCEGGPRQSPASARITYVQDFYGEKYSQYAGDLICCRHVFEHIPDPGEFLSLVRRAIGERRSAVVYFEVPNVRFILEKLSIWDIIYEHCNYFSIESLAAVFQRCGFVVVRLEETYGTQFLSIDARISCSTDRGSWAGGSLLNLKASVERFSELAQKRLQAWKLRIAQWSAGGRRAVIWGGGAKAVSFLNMLKITDTIPYVVDINPHKQGRYLPGTGQRVVAPEFLKEFQPQTVVVMNPMYRQEVESELRTLGVVTEVLEA
jgi:SAM-dependent methyltransferase